MDRALAIVCLLLMGCAFGCARFSVNSATQYETVVASDHRDSAEARRKHNRALRFLEKCDDCKAEQLLRESLLADVSFGPAHNTLGKLYFDQKKYYLAAWEFDHAARLMPQRAEPVNNLGLVFEATQQIDSAIEQYHAAFTMESDHPVYLGNLVRARFRRGDRTDDLKELMQQILLVDDRPSWTHWARLTLSMWDSKWNKPAPQYGLENQALDGQGLSPKSPGNGPQINSEELPRGNLNIVPDHTNPVPLNAPNGPSQYFGN